MVLAQVAPACMLIIFPYKRQDVITILRKALSDVGRKNKDFIPEICFFNYFFMLLKLKYSMYYISMYLILAYV